MILSKEVENPEERALAVERANALRPILELDEAGQEIGPLLLEAAKMMGVSRSTAWDFYRRLKINDG